MIEKGLILKQCVDFCTDNARSKMEKCAVLLNVLKTLQWLLHHDQALAVNMIPNIIKMVLKKVE
jgi:hypothetical protein